MKSRALAVSGIVGIAIALILFTQFLREPTITYQTMTQAYRDVKGLNYTCCSDRSDGIVDYGFMVSKDTASWKDAGGLCKVGPMGDNWKNKVWMTPIHADTSMPTVPEDADVRIWGRVFVFGDSALISELEHGLRKKGVFTL